MLNILFALLAGFLLGLVGLDTLFDNALGFTTQQYYLVWFLLGAAVWLVNLIKK
ncbi:hypothetical protein [Paenibacillus sp. Soil724D2]|uniref:hypothetical protein n=1 Tax=Paenibacillus sp. (strain Soil724D2) TaxID=1736392 RepID=UPI000AF4E284|nr:hypothetical protein [Paenibacillus sp. Soil724D2]